MGTNHDAGRAKQRAARAKAKAEGLRYTEALRDIEKNDESVTYPSFILFGALYRVMTTNRDRRHCKRVEHFLRAFHPETLYALNLITDQFSERAATVDGPQVTASMAGAGGTAVDGHLLLRSETQDRVNTMWVSPDGQMYPGYIQGLDPDSDADVFVARQLDPTVVNDVLSQEYDPAALRTLLRSAAFGDPFFLGRFYSHIVETVGLANDEGWWDVLDTPERLDDSRVRKAWGWLASGGNQIVIRSASLRAKIHQMRPTTIEHLAALYALDRPGQMSIRQDETYVRRATGREPWSYDHLTTDTEEASVIASVLDETFGVLVFQEQVLALVEQVGGFDSALAPVSRKALAKADSVRLKPLREQFIDGGRRGAGSVAFRTATLEAVWDEMTTTAPFLCSRVHARQYVLQTYRLAAAKANWPDEFEEALIAAL